jgi:hypothetical protein
MGTTFFCPFCGRQSPDDDPICSRCGKSLDRWREYPFEERPLLTLRHPLPEHQMIAIQLLGLRKYGRAVPVFTKMVAAGQDVYVLRDIAIALSQMDTPDSRQVFERLRDHPSPVVRQACKEPGRQAPEGGAR